MNTPVFAIFLRSLALGLNLVTLVVIARTIGAERVGQSGLGQSIAVLVNLFSGLNLDAHLVRELRGYGSHLKASELISAVVLQRFAFVVPLSLIGAIYLLHGGSSVFVVLGMALIAVGLVTNPSWLFQADGRQGRILAGMLLQNGLSLALIVVFLKPSSSSGLDLTLQGIAAVISNGFLWVNSSFRKYIFELSSLNILRRRHLLVRKYLMGGRWLTAIGLISYIYTASELLIVNSMYDATDVGVYRVASQVNAAMAAIAALLPLYIYPKLIDAQNSGGVMVLWKTQCEMIGRLVPLVAGGFLVFAIFAWFAIPLVVGIEYRGASIIAVVLIAARCIALVGSVFLWGLRAKGEDYLTLKIVGLAAAASMILNFLNLGRLAPVFVAVASLTAELIVAALSYRAMKPVVVE